MTKVNLLLGALMAAGLITATVVGQTKTNSSASQPNTKGGRPLVTFVELGSVNCIPCRAMQPVMKAIEEKYAGQVSVVFHDVWKADERQYAEKYAIRVIPTQVFLDKDGKEFFRHEGFYPESEIHKLLEKQGLKARSEG